MPVPQEINFIVEQASCLFLTMVQDVSLIVYYRQYFTAMPFSIFNSLDPNLHPQATATNIHRSHLRLHL